MIKRPHSDKTHRLLVLNIDKKLIRSLINIEQVQSFGNPFLRTHCLIVIIYIFDCQKPLRD